MRRRMEGWTKTIRPLCTRPDRCRWLQVGLARLPGGRALSRPGVSSRSGRVSAAVIPADVPLATDVFTRALSQASEWEESQPWLSRIVCIPSSSPLRPTPDPPPRAPHPVRPLPRRAATCSQEHRSRGSISSKSLSSPWRWPSPEGINNARSCCVIRSRRLAATARSRAPDSPGRPSQACAPPWRLLQAKRDSLSSSWASVQNTAWWPHNVAYDESHWRNASSPDLLLQSWLQPEAEPTSRAILVILLCCHAWLLFDACHSSQGVRPLRVNRQDQLMWFQGCERGAVVRFLRSLRPGSSLLTHDCYKHPSAPPCAGPRAKARNASRGIAAQAAVVGSGIETV